MLNPIRYLVLAACALLSSQANACRGLSAEDCARLDRQEMMRSQEVFETQRMTNDRMMRESVDDMRRSIDDIDQRLQRRGY